MAFCSIFTNIVLFAYASNEIDSLIPYMGRVKEDSLVSILTVFGIEHVILLFIIALWYIFDKEPKWVKIFFAR